MFLPGASSGTEFVTNDWHDPPALDSGNANALRATQDARNREGYSDSILGARSKVARELR